jgi:hypothetical protein
LLEGLRFPGTQLAHLQPYLEVSWEPLSGRHPGIENCISSEKEEKMWHGVQHGVFKALLLPQEHPALPAMALLLFSM